MIIPAHGRASSKTTITTTTSTTTSSTFATFTESTFRPFSSTPKLNWYQVLPIEEGPNPTASNPPPELNADVAAIAAGVFGGMVAIALLCCLCTFRRQIFYRQRGWTMEKWSKFKDLTTNDPMQRSQHCPGNLSVADTHSTTQSHEEKEEENGEDDDRASKASRPESRTSKSIQSMSIGASNRRVSLKPVQNPTPQRPSNRTHFPATATSAATMSISSKTSRAASANWYRVIELPLSPDDTTRCSGAVRGCGASERSRVVYQPVSDPFSEEGERELYCAREPSIATTTFIAVEEVDDSDGSDKEQGKSRDEKIARRSRVNTMTTEGDDDDDDDDDDAKTTRSSIRSAIERSAKMLYKDRQDRRRRSHISEYFSDHESLRIRSRSRDREGQERSRRGSGGSELRSWVDLEVGPPGMILPSATTIEVGDKGHRTVMPTITATRTERNEQSISSSCQHTSVPPRPSPAPLATAVASSRQQTPLRNKTVGELSSTLKKKAIGQSTGNYITTTTPRIDSMGANLPITATPVRVSIVGGTMDRRATSSGGVKRAEPSTAVATEKVKPSTVSINSSKRTPRTRSSLCVPPVSTSVLSPKAARPVSGISAATTVHRRVSGKPASRPVSTLVNGPVHVKSTSQLSSTLQSPLFLSPAAAMTRTRKSETVTESTNPSTMAQMTKTAPSQCDRSSTRARARMTVGGGCHTLGSMTSTTPKPKPAMKTSGTRRTATVKISTGSRRETARGKVPTTAAAVGGVEPGATKKPRVSITWPTAIYAESSHRHAPPKSDYFVFVNGAKQM